MIRKAKRMRKREKSRIENVDLWFKFIKYLKEKEGYFAIN